MQGTLSFTAASTYMVQVSPTNAGRTNVTGTATLGGATVNAVFLPGSYVNRQYTIVNATGGVSGTFNPAVISNNANIQSTLSYDANNAYLNIELVFATPPSGSLNVNQQNVANALTGFFDRTGGIPAAFASLNAAGLTIASGELGTGIIQSSIMADNLFLNLLLDPSVAGRAGGFAPGGGASHFADDEAQAYAAKRRATPSERDAFAMARKAPALLAARPANRWSIWGAAYGGSATTRRQRRGRVAGHHGTRLWRHGRRGLQGHAGYPDRIRARRRRHQLFAGQRARPAARRTCSRPAPSRGIISARPMLRRRWPMAGTTLPPTARWRWPASTSCRAASGPTPSRAGSRAAIATRRR